MMKRRLNMSPKFKIILLVILLVVSCGSVALGYWIWKTDQEVVAKLEQRNFLPPIEFYAAPESFRAGTTVDLTALKTKLLNKNYRERAENQRLYPQDFSVLSAESCRSLLGDYFPEGSVQCLSFVASQLSEKQVPPLSVLAVDESSSILGTFAGFPPTPRLQVELEPAIFAQYLGTEPIFQKHLALGEIPPLCLNAVLAIEDPGFLEHGGISFTGIMRAAVMNLMRGRSAQGGSTITQQLVKNFFLTPEKTFKRKAKEALISIILESRASKDQILETYLNIIYLGQSGPFQVRGFGAASQYYFAKNIADLQLHECALLATVLNSPGLWSPFTRPEKALQRRELVLSKMREQNHISEEEMNEANAQPLPKRASLQLNETAPYFVDAALKQLETNGISQDQGLKVFTTLQLDAQVAAQAAVIGHIENLEANNKKIRKLKEEGLNLEGMLLSGDPITGEIAAVVGGRSFKKTQFNRAVDAHRQVGSIMKPLVYLTALEHETPEGTPYTPTTLIEDKKFSYRVDRRNVWSPENYGKKFYGTVPLFYALKDSLNAATAQLGLNVGIENVVATARRLGIESKLDALPSITLGAFELYPVEVIRAYMAMATLGTLPNVTFIRQVETSDGEVIYTFFPENTQAIDPTTMSLLVGMMKQSIISGTAAAVYRSGFTHPAAGKTGTTNDNRDAWFVGYTPYHITLSWVGYDNNTITGLTGGSGAVPIWISYMKNFGARFPPDDFRWPDTVRMETLDEETLKSLGALQDSNDPKSVDLIMRAL